MLNIRQGTCAGGGLACASAHRAAPLALARPVCGRRRAPPHVRGEGTLCCASRKQREEQAAADLASSSAPDLSEWARVWLVCARKLLLPPSFNHPLPHTET